MSKPRLLYVVVEDWAFLSNRLPMARAARDAGYEVHVATQVNKDKDALAIKSEGFTLHHVPFARGKLSPVLIARTIRAIRDVKQRVRPTITHHVSMQPTVYGALASVGMDEAHVNALTGLGFAFTSETAKARLLRPLVAGTLRLLLHRPASRTIVQNRDDRAALVGLGLDASRLTLIEGSGVDLETFVPVPEPAGRVTIGFVGRLLGDKGIHALLAAHRELRSRGHDVQLAIAGFRDAGNPTSVTENEIDRWKADPSIVFHGKIDHTHIDRIAEFWATAHIAALPSRREGLPKVLLEAAGCGRPLVATDVPGCRSVVIPGQNGYLVPVDDPQALANALASLVQSRELREQMGKAARQHVEQRFGAKLIGEQILEIYSELARPRKKASRAA